jgi:hypothetical protein
MIASRSSAQSDTDGIEPFSKPRSHVLRIPAYRTLCLAKIAPHLIQSPKAGGEISEKNQPTSGYAGARASHHREAPKDLPVILLKY